MNHLLPPAAALLLLALTACPAKKPETAQTTGPAAGAAAPPADSPGATYQLYRGGLAGRPDSLTLHLTITPPRRGSEEIGSLYGSYYGADGQPHELGSQRTVADSLVLSEYDHAARDADGNEPEIMWRLRREPGGNLSGTRAGRPLRLRRAVPALRLAVRTFADSVAAFPGQAASPYGQVSLQTLVPAGGVSPATTQALAANILRQQRGDTLPDQPTPALARFWQQSREEFTKDYRASAAETAPDPTDPADSAAVPDYALRFEEQQHAFVICQQGRLLSLGLSSYSYTGGAHGSFGTRVVSFDLATGRPLTFNDLFRPEARTGLLPLLDRGVRRTLGLAPGAALDSQLLVKDLTLTTNVCLTPGGALFIYQPYEIAAYALGEVEVFVPLAELQPLLRAGLPLPTGGQPL